MTSPPVGEPTPREVALMALAAELTPAKSLQRLDAATARVVSTVSVIATLFTGLGLIAAGQSNLAPASRDLAVVAVVLAFLAVLLALTAQILTVTRDLNTSDLEDVSRWYAKRFGLRAPLTQGASIVLVAAAAAAGAASITSLTAGAPPPTVAITRTATKLDIDLTFRGLDVDQAATAIVTADKAVVATATFGATKDGTATRTLAIDQVPVSAVITVNARAGSTSCTAVLDPSQPAELHCTST